MIRLPLLLLLVLQLATQCASQKPARDTVNWQITVAAQGAVVYNYAATRVRDSIWIGLPTLQQYGFQPARLRFQPGQPVLYASGGRLHEGYTADPAHSSGNFLLPVLVLGNQPLWLIETMDCTLIQVLDSEVFDQHP